MEGRFSAFLQKYRQMRGITVERLAKAMGCGRTRVQHLLSGQVPPPRGHCEILSDVLNLSEAERNRFLRQAAYERRHCDPWYSTILEAEKSELEKHLKSAALKVKTKQTSVKEGKPMYRGVPIPADADKIWGLEIDNKGKIENGDFVLAVVYKPGDRSHESPDVYLAQYRTTRIPDQVFLIPLMRDAPPLTVSREDVELHLVLGARLIE